MRILLLLPPLFLMACDLQVRDRGVCTHCGVVDGWNEDGMRLTDVLGGLERAFEERDKELYETLLDDDFLFTEQGCSGDSVYINDLVEELGIIGPRDGSREGVFDYYRTIGFRFHLLARFTELAGESPEHPTEDWEVFSGRVEMQLLRRPDQGKSVDQGMTFKMRLGEDRLWRIVRWHDEAWGCETAQKAS